MTCVHLITSCCSSNIIDIQQRTPFALYWAAFVKLMPLTIGGAKDQGCHAEGRGCHDRFSAIARPAKLLPHCVSKCLDCFHSWSWCLDDKNRGIWTRAVPGIASLDQISFLDRSGFRYTFPRMLKSVTVKPEFLSVRFFAAHMLQRDTQAPWWHRTCRSVAYCCSMIYAAKDCRSWLSISTSTTEAVLDSGHTVRFKRLSKSNRKLEFVLKEAQWRWIKAA